MSKLLDKREEAVVKYLAFHPGSSEYKIHEEVKLTFQKEILHKIGKTAMKEKEARLREEMGKIMFSRIFVLRKVNMLANKGFLRLESGPRNANLCWLTAKGLIYVVQQGVIEPKTALDIMQKHNIEIPCSTRCGKYGDTTGKWKCPEVRDFMEQQPEAFFKVLSRLPNILESPQDDLSKHTCLAAMLGAFYLFLTDAEFYKQSCLNDLHFGCHGVADTGPPKNTEISIMSIAKPFLSILGFDIPIAPPCSIEID